MHLRQRTNFLLSIFSLLERGSSNSSLDGKTYEYLCAGIGLTLLAEAAAKVTEAIAKLPEAADLGAAAKTFQTRADGVAAAIPAIEKDAAGNGDFCGRPR